MTKDIEPRKPQELEFADIKNPRQRVFLKTYSKCGNISKAAEMAGISRRSHYDWLHDPEYQDQFALAEKAFIQVLEAEADRRGLEGIDDIVVQGGKIVKDDEGEPLIKKKHSDNLLMFRLKKLDPSYRENYDHTMRVLHGLDTESVKETMKLLREHGFQPTNPIISEEKMRLEPPSDMEKGISP